MESTRQPKEYGLLFIAAMARAAVAGIKTQTRRLPTASNSLVDGVGISAKRWADMQFDWSRAVVDKGPSPAGNPGPYLHVPAGNGETWQWHYPYIRSVIGFGAGDVGGWRHEPCLEHEREYHRRNLFSVIRYPWTVKKYGIRATADVSDESTEASLARPTTCPCWAHRPATSRLSGLSGWRTSAHDDANGRGHQFAADDHRLELQTAAPSGRVRRPLPVMASLRLAPRKRRGRLRRAPGVDQRPWAPGTKPAGDRHRVCDCSGESQQHHAEKFGKRRNRVDLGRTRAAEKPNWATNVLPQHSSRRSAATARCLTQLR